MKIMAICGSGLGSSFMVEMNIKKVLKKMGVEAEVEHSDLSSAIPGAADVVRDGERHRRQRQRTGRAAGGDQQHHRH